MKPTINILHIIGSADIAGGERYLYDLIKHSADVFKHWVVLPHSGLFESMLKEARYSYSIIDLNKKMSINSLIKIIKLITKKKISIVHSHGYRANFYARLSCIITGKINVSTAHVSLYDYIDTSSLKKFLYIFFEKILSGKASKIICISHAMKRDMLKLGINKNKLTLISNGVDLERFKFPYSNQKRQMWGIDSAEPLIGTVGRMVTEKGQIYLLKALKEIKTRYPRIKCLFVGDGPLLYDLQQKAKSSDIYDCCIFTGTVKDIESIYPVLDIFVLPSLREPFGLALLEAMACGIPVIATNTGGPKDYICDGKNGYLIPKKSPNDISQKIFCLLQNSNLRKLIGTNARLTAVNNFDIKKTVRLTDKVYLDVIEKNYNKSVI